MHNRARRTFFVRGTGQGPADPPILPRMTVKGIRAALTQARKDGKVDVAEVDKIVLKARSGWGLDPSERAELVKMADSFDDPARQRLLSHLSAMGQKNAWVNVEAGGLTSVKGRYANYTVGVPGLSARLGLFDNCFSLKGAAKADGLVKVAIEGQNVSVQVKKGETAAQVLAKVKAALPSQVSGVLLQGDVQPFDGASYQGTAASATDTAAHLMLYKPASLGLKPGELPLKVVVTGYGAFMGITDNPSANMAQKLAEAGVKGGIVEYRRLDVTPEAVDAFIGEMRRSPPDVILSMGVTARQRAGGRAPREPPRRRERRQQSPHGRSRGARGRAAGAVHRSPRRGHRPGAACPSATSGWWAPAGATRTTQPDRSAYLCNYLGYNLASEFGGTPKTTAGFMHISAQTPADQMHAVLEAVTARQLEMRRARKRRPGS